MKNQFAQLLDELNTEAETLAKSLNTPAAGDGKIAAAAGADAAAAATAAAGDEDDAAAAAPAPGAAPAPAAAPAAAPMAKSFVDADGQTVEYVDGTELVKALETELASTQTGVFKLLKAQGEVIKSLAAEITLLKSRPAGRSALLTVAPRQPAAAPAPAAANGMQANEFMAKSHAAYDAKRISGAELNTIDVCLRKGVAIDSEVIAKVLA